MAIETLPVWPFEPNWSGTYTEALEWLTDILTSPKGAEQRRSLRLYPRKTIEFTSAVGENDNQVLRQLLEAHGGRNFYLPQWHESYRSTAAVVVGADFIPCPGANNGGIRPGDVIFIGGAKARQYELAEVGAVSPSGVTVTAPLTKAWAPFSKIHPCRKARLDDQPTLRKVTDRAVTFTTSFRIMEVNDEGGSASQVRDAGPMIMNGLITNSYHEETGRGGYFHSNSGTSEGQFIFIYGALRAYEALRTGTVEERVVADYYLKLAQEMLDGMGDGSNTGPMLRQPIPANVNTITLMHWLFAARGDVPEQGIVYEFEATPSAGKLVIPMNANGNTVHRVWQIYPATSELLYQSPYSPSFDVNSPSGDTSVEIKQWERVGDTAVITIPAGASAPTWKIVYGYSKPASIPMGEGYEAFPSWTRIPPGYAACAPDTFRWFEQAMERAVALDDRTGKSTDWQRLRLAMRRSAVRGQAITDLREVFRPLPGFPAIPASGEPDGMYCFSDHPDATPPIAPGLDNNWLGYDFWSRAGNGDIVGDIPASSVVSQVQIGRGFADEWRTATSYQEADQFLYVAVSASKKPVAANKELFLVYVSSTMDYNEDQRWYADIGSLSSFVATSGDVIEFFIPRSAFRLRSFDSNGNTVWGSPLPGNKISNDFSSGFTVARNSIGTYVDSSGVIRTAAANVPRFNHDPLTGANRGLLVEPARTNYIYPSTPTAAWGMTSGTTLTFGVDISPSGSNDAVRMGSSSTTGSRYIYRATNTTSYTAGTRYTAGYFIKKIPGVIAPVIRVVLHSNAFGSNREARFDLNNPAAGISTVGSPEEAGVIPLADDWYYLWVSHTATTTTTTWAPLLWWTSVANLDFAHLVWGCQLEVGSRPSSYIPTTTAVVTRQADTVTIAATGANDWAITQFNGDQVEFDNVSGNLSFSSQDLTSNSVLSYEYRQAGVGDLHIENFGISSEMSGSYQIRLRAMRLVSDDTVEAVEGAPMPFFPGALPFAINADTIRQQFVGWNGSPFHGYQLPDFWWWIEADAEAVHPDLTVADLPIPDRATGAITYPITPLTAGGVSKPKHALLMEQQLLFLKHAQLQWTEDGGGVGPFAHTFVLNTPARSSLGNPTPHTWVYTNDDPNTRWVGYQVRIIESLALLIDLAKNNSAFADAVNLAEQMVEDWLEWLNGFWPNLNGKVVGGKRIYGMPTDFDDPAKGAPQTLYEEPHAAGIILRACLWLEKAGRGNTVINQALMTRCWNYLEMMWRTEGEMRFTWSPDPAAKQWYGFWHGEILTTLADLVLHQVHVPMTINIATVRQRMVQTRTWMTIYGVSYNNAGVPVEFLDTYDGFNVIAAPPDEGDGVDFGFTRMIDTLDNQTSIPRFFDVPGIPFPTQKHNWVLNGRSAYDQFKRTLFALRGRGTSLWLPSFADDMRIVDDTPTGDKYITVENFGFTLSGGLQTGHEHIVIFYLDGTREYRRIVGSTMLDDDREIIGVDQAFYMGLKAADVLRVSFMRLARLDQDRLEIVHVTDTQGVSRCSATFKAAPNLRLVKSGF